jgi:hypothetical protein
MRIEILADAELVAQQAAAIIARARINPAL